MKLVTTTGYGGTGSSAVTDLISEYSGVYTNPHSTYEIALLKHPQGIHNLYYHLVEFPLPETSNRALHDYYKLCRKLATRGTSMNYEGFFGRHFMEYTSQYIEELGGGDFYLTYYEADINVLQRFVRRVVNKAYRTFYLWFVHRDKSEGFIKFIPLFQKPEKFYLFSVDREKFIQATQKYLYRLFSGISDREYINLHHLVPIAGIKECMQYFDNMYVISTERDPRDIFLTAKYKWRAVDYPYNDVQQFCRYYRWLRKFSEIEESDRIMHIQFEDMIFSYDEIERRIENFLGLDHNDHVKKWENFDPKVSIGHCNLKESYPEERANIDIIERELSEYLYDFKKYLGR